MDVSKLIRDPKRVQAYLEELPDGSLVCKKPVKIYIPARFEERALAQIGIDTYIVGVYAIVVEDTYYGVSLVNAMLPIEPTSTLKIQIEGDDYYEFSFDAGSVVCPSVDLVKNDVLVYKIYDEIISKGRVPWYLGYLELAKIFDTAKYHAGANIGANQEVTELIISMIARDEKDRNKNYRTTITALDQLQTNRPAFIPLRSVQFAATNTTNKLAGSYFSDALVSALVNPSDRVERIESLLRA
jgi:hypothetical protein